MKSKVDISHLSKLTNVSPSKSFSKKLASQFQDTLKVVDQLNELDTKDITPTPQVTGKTNQLRDDIVDKSRLLSQKEALGNAKTTHEGYFVVPRLID